LWRRETKREELVVPRAAAVGRVVVVVSAMRSKAQLTSVVVVVVAVARIMARVTRVQYPASADRFSLVLLVRIV
jgi:hypothetical protein